MNRTSELSNPCWAVITERGVIASSLTYSFARRVQRDLLPSTMHAMIVSNEAAARETAARNGNSLKPQTAKALSAIANALGADRVTVCFDPSDPHCPDCGAVALWEDCDRCGGVGRPNCFCEGLGGQFICSRQCS